jgi:hypothetical protein
MSTFYGLGGEVAAWIPSLDPNAGTGTVLKDLVGDADMTLTNSGMWLNDATGLWCIRGNGSSTIGQAALGGAMFGAKIVTMSAWIRSQTSTNFASILGGGNGTHNWVLAAGSSSFYGQNGLYFDGASGVAAYCLTNPAGDIPSNTWSHVVIQFKGSGATNADKLKIWTNNVARTLAFNGTFPTMTGSVTTTIALCGQSAGVAYGQFDIDGCRFYRRELSSTERALLFSSRKYQNFSRVPLGRIISGGV